ncbi:MAG: molybdopterin oxidoreductase family protein [Alphaproteobacteria bacterium]|nr:molybdopterin oxidoreductase family protein [Alphaproteobacteria bacterium]
MNDVSTIPRKHSVCPHDCPSACALEVEVLDGNRIGRVYGSKKQSYTAGVICAKVARYAERNHHPDRLLYPMKRIGKKGEGSFTRISWDEALDEIGARFNAIEAEYGTEAIWPYHYAGTMGLIQRDGIKRLTNTKNYSQFYSTICINLAWPGFIAGTGKLMGPDPREMAKSDCVVIWGTNAVSTQVNVMTHAVQARKMRAAKIVAIDVYRTPTLEQADLPIVLKPGTDGALACAVMLILFRDNLADWDYLEKHTDHPHEFASHLKSKTPEWASAITGVPVATIEEFAQLVGMRKKTFFRLGYGFSRQRNGAVNMHAASCIAAVTGAWQYKGGGAFHNNGAIYHWRKSLIEGLEKISGKSRWLDQSRIGAVLTNQADALNDGGPVRALLVQSTNPVSVAPEQNKVVKGFEREDLLTVVHEHFMTDTARYADILLPATMFTEHDDIYQGGGHQYIGFGPKLIDPPGECKTNHFLLCEIAKRVGASHQAFTMSEREIIDWTLQQSGWGALRDLEDEQYIDAQPPFEEAHFINGFHWPDKKFRFKPEWSRVPFAGGKPMGPLVNIPEFPDHWNVIEEANDTYPFRLATSPARNYLNSTFTETKTSREREGEPSVMIHPDDAKAYGLTNGAYVKLSNQRGETTLKARYFDGVVRGVLIAESIWPNTAYKDGKGINRLTGADAPAPFGGAAFHDNRVAITPL